MTKTLKVFIFFLCCLGCKKTEIEKIEIATSDIDNFWLAFDKVQSTKDSIKQIKYIQSLFIDRGTLGLKAIMKARRYTAQSYQVAINKYPKFWKSLRSNILNINMFSEGIAQGIYQFKKLYPDAKPAEIYFTMGALRTGGTTLENKVLIGSEIALADDKVDFSELEKDYPHLPKYFKNNNPKKSIVFGNIHEYVHTQQDTTIANSLLSKTLIEGVAEFIAEKTLNISSPNEAVIYGKINDEKIKNAFVKELFTDFEIMWFWSNTNNQFKVGDLGYYVGYAICKSYFEQAKNKQKAIKEMIELDYLNTKKVYQFVDESKYFDKNLAFYEREIEIKRPRVVEITEFKNNSKNVDSSIKTMTIEFSKPMNTEFINLRLGPLGEENLVKVTENLGWSKDGKKITYKVKLKPNLRQQILITDIFRSTDGYLLAPYLIDITTK